MLRRILPRILATLLLLIPATATAVPVVDGLFYGLGDDSEYVLWNTSVYGSGLYIYYDAPNTTLHVALVVTRAVNDNVFTDSPPDTNAYMLSANWGGGGGQQRGADRLVDSEFATFTLECAPGSGPRYEWQQGYACTEMAGPPTGPWVSDLTCDTSAVLAGDPVTLDSALTSSSSFVANVNAWQTSGTPWANLYRFGTSPGQWKSPLATTTDVTTLEGYPLATTAELGPPPDPTAPIITFGTFSGSIWEWAMVYEWSMNLATAGCGDEAIFLVTGLSHHSPMKSLSEGTFDGICGEENDCFPDPPGGGNPLSDYGDLPTGYPVLASDNGPRHQITSTGPYMGSLLDPEIDGNPDGSAEGDDTLGPDDEDGLTLVSGNWTPGTQETIEVTLARVTASTVLAGWFDWNGDGDFDDANEYQTWSVTPGEITGDGLNTLTIDVGTGFDTTAALAVRLRVFSSDAAAPGGSLDSGDFVGLALDGEVEDYIYPPNSLPVTLNAFASELGAGSRATVSWQTASETDNVGFEILGQVGDDWLPLSDFIGSKGMNSALPQSYETEIFLPEGVTAIELVDYDTRGRPERFGPFRPGSRYGEFQAPRRIDWRGPRKERNQRLADRGFVPVGPTAATNAGQPPARPRWRKLQQSGIGPAAGSLARLSRSSVFARPGESGTPVLETDPLTHVAVTEPGIQRVSYQALRDAGLDLTGVPKRDIAVTWRGKPVTRWITGRGTIGPGSVIEFIGRPPQGEDALYLDANLYQVSVDPTRARKARRGFTGRVRRPSPSYLHESMVDRPAMHHRQSPTGDPWVEDTVLVQSSGETVNLEIPVEGPVLNGLSELIVGLGPITDLPDLTGPGGEVIPEHNVEIWFGGPGGPLVHLADAATSGQRDWQIVAQIPPGILQPGVNRLQLRFATDYLYSLLVIDRYGVRYPGPYLGPELDFDADPDALGYRVSGFATPSIAAYAERDGGELVRLEPWVTPDGGGYAAELRHLPGVHYWLDDSPHTPAVFTTDAPDDRLTAAGDLVVIADSSFIGTRALEDYLVERADLRPVVVDVEDIYNSAGFGMALPSAITDYLRARDAVQPFSHVQLVGSDCYDRLNYISSCISFIPLPTAPVGVTIYSPSQNRLVDLDGDGVGDKAVAQFSVRDEAELDTIVRKGAAWSASRLAGDESALLIAEETDGIHDFSAQIDRLKLQLGWADSDVLELADHPSIATAREAMRSSLDQGRTVTIFSGHSSPSVWAFRALLTAAGVAQLTNFDQPTLMVPLACETTYDLSPHADVLGHQLLYAGDQGALAISGAVALSSLDDNERMAGFILGGLKAGLTLGEAVQIGREALGTAFQTLQDNWMTQGDVAATITP